MGIFGKKEPDFNTLRGALEAAANYRGGRGSRGGNFIATKEQRAAWTREAQEQLEQTGTIYGWPRETVLDEGGVAAVHRWAGRGVPYSQTDLEFNYGNPDGDLRWNHDAGRYVSEREEWEGEAGL